MRPELTAAFVASFVAGLFGLVPLMVQIATTRAQRRDRMTRLNHLRAELELLERLHTLQGKVSATDEAAKPRTNLAISDALSNLWDQYNKLSEIAPSAVVGGKEPSSQQLSFLRRMFLLYTPHTSSGWILHTLFYMFAIFFVLVVFLTVGLAVEVGMGAFLTSMIVYVIPASFLLLITQRRARRNAAHNAAQPEEPDT
jgi:hypothetical protein